MAAYTVCFKDPTTATSTRQEPLPVVALTAEVEGLRQEPLPVGPYGPERDRPAYALTAEVEGLGAPAKLILMLLESRCTSTKRQCWPSWEWLMRKSGLRRTCLAKALGDLRSSGLVGVVRSGSRRDRSSTLYEVARPVDGLDGPVVEPLRSATRTSKPSLRSATRTPRVYVRTEGKEEEEEVRAIPPDDLTTTTTVVMDDGNPAIAPSTPTADVPEADVSTADPPTDRQREFIADVSAELGEPAPAPATRREAIPVVADLIARRDGSRAAAREAARLDAKVEGRRQQGAAAGQTFPDRVAFASAAKCDGCETIQYPEPGGRCPGCGESMRQWEPPAGVGEPSTGGAADGRLSSEPAGSPPRLLSI